MLFIQQGIQGRFRCAALSTVSNGSLCCARNAVQARFSPDALTSPTDPLVMGLPCINSTQTICCAKPCKQLQQLLVQSFACLVPQASRESRVPNALKHVHVAALPGQPALHQTHVAHRCNQ